MKVLLICERLEGNGGWYTYSKDLRDELQRKGHEVTVVSQLGADGDYALLPSPLVCMSLPYRLFFAARKIEQMVKQMNPDVIHITVEPYAMLVPFLSKELMARCVLTIHGSYGIRPLETWLTKRFATKYYRHINHFITVSKYTKKAVTGALQIYIDTQTAQHFHENSMVIENGITIRDKELGIRDKGGRKNILLVGGVKPRKGVLEAIEGLGKYKKDQGNAFHFKVIGTKNEESPYMQKIQERIKELDLVDHVEFTGQVSDSALADAYREADVYFMPASTNENTFEGFGLVYIEANAYGVPCIGPQTSGAAEAIVDGETGLQVNSSDAESIANALHRILDENAIDTNNCREWAESHSIEKTVEQIVHVYRQMQ